MGRRRPVGDYPRYYKHKLLDDMMWKVDFEGDHPWLIASRGVVGLPYRSECKTEKSLLSSQHIYRTTEDGKGEILGG